MTKKKNLILPLKVEHILSKLGNDINAARRRRRISMALMVERATTSYTTLYRLEKGDPTVSLGVVATVLYILGMEERLADLADVRFDEVGRMIDAENLPKRIISKRKNDE